MISLETGEAQGADSGRVRTIPVELVDGVVMLRLDANADARKGDARCMSALSADAGPPGA